MGQHLRAVYAALTGVKFDYATALRLPLLEPRPTDAKGLFSDLNRQVFLWQDEHPDTPQAW